MFYIDFKFSFPTFLNRGGDHRVELYKVGIALLLLICSGYCYLVFNIINNNMYLYLFSIFYMWGNIYLFHLYAIHFPDKVK